MSEGAAKKEERRKFQAIKGTRDILPPETALWNRVEQTAHEVFATFGYGEIRLPIFEETELFARSVGADTDIVNKEMYVLDLYGSSGMEYLQQEISRYPEEFTVGQFEEMVAQFATQIETAIATKIYKPLKALENYAEISLGKRNPPRGATHQIGHRTCLS